MAFTIQRTGRTISGGGLGAVPSVDVRTGAGQVAQAIGQAGSAVAGAAEVLHKLEADNQFSEARRKLQEKLNAVANDFEKDPDSSTYQQRFDEAMGEMKEFAPKNSLAARSYAQLLKDTRVSGNAMVQESKLARERDLFKAEVLHDIAGGHFLQARGKLQKGPRNGYISSVDAQQMLATIDRKEAVALVQAAEDQRKEEIRVIVNTSLGAKTEDDALDYVREQGFKLKWDKADMTFAEGLARDDFQRAEAAKVEKEEGRVREAETDLSKRLFVAQNKTTAGQIHDADLPRVERDALLGLVRQRDKDIAEKNRQTTAPLVRSRYNVLKREVALGKKSAIDAVLEYREFSEHVDGNDHGANIDGFFKAEEASKDPAQRRIQTILAGREKTLRDRIEAEVSIFADDQSEKDFMQNLANDAVNDLLDQYADVSTQDFNLTELDAFVDELTEKYAITAEALTLARQSQGILRAKTFKEQVEAVQRRVAFLRRRGKTLEARDVLDEAIRLGLAKPDGKPAGVRDEEGNVMPVPSSGINDLIKKYK